MKFLNSYERQLIRDKKKIDKGWRPYFLIFPMRLGKYVYWLQWIERRVSPVYTRDIIGMLVYDHRLNGKEY